MMTRKEIWEMVFSKLDLGGMPEVTLEFLLQSVMLEVLLDNRDLLVEMRDLLVPSPPEQRLGP